MLNGGLKLSKKARTKISKLSPTEFEMFNLVITLSLLKPELYLDTQAYGSFEQNDKTFDYLLAAIPGAMVLLFISNTDEIGIYDFHLNDTSPDYVFYVT